MIQKAVATFIIFFIIAFFIGGWGEIILRSFGAGCTLGFRVAFGGCMTLLLGMTVCIGSGALCASAQACIYAAAILISLTGIAGIIVRKRMNFPSGYKTDPGMGAADIIGLCVIAAVIVFQIWSVMRYQSDNTQVLSGIGTATRVYDTGFLFVAEPVNLFIGAVSFAMRIHPLAFIYGIIPAPLILMYYLCYFEVLRTVCSTWHKTVIAFATVAMLNIWGYQSERLIPVTLLISWFGFWVFLVHGVMNVSAVIIVNYLQTVKSKDLREKTEDEEEYSEEWDMKKHKIVNARNLAIGLGVLALILIMAVFVLNNKINRLYAATVNIQEDMNSRCSIYEFKPDGNATEGYLIRESDGKITFIGGGGEQNAEDLGLFFEKYGNSVETWYVYSDDEENAGAMKALISEGVITPDKVYVTNRKEITDFK